MNRFLIKRGKEELFEEMWKSRETHLDKFPGFLKFNLLKGIIKDDVTLYASHTEWVSKSNLILIFRDYFLQIRNRSRKSNLD